MALSSTSREEPLLKSSEDKKPTDWSKDGRFILYSTEDPKTKSDLWVLPLGGDGKPIPFLQTPFDERHGQFSPDGRYVAYTSDESGRHEVGRVPFLVEIKGEVLQDWVCRGLNLKKGAPLNGQEQA